jgi:HK97 family phage major capsid protein
MTSGWRRSSAHERRRGDGEKVDRINRAVDEAKARLDELTLKAQRPQLSGETAQQPAAREHKQAFDSYVRKGETQGLTRSRPRP